VSFREHRHPEADCGLHEERLSQSALGHCLPRKMVFRTLPNLSLAHAISYCSLPLAFRELREKPVMRVLFKCRFQGYRPCDNDDLNNLYDTVLGN
jgi:hypothetical protein